ncbi:hypothetical protein OAJ66_00955, partial [Nitrosopumilus sp.]|nr:hypothetical protein [Nitrosopumilus sp.]
MKTKLVGLGTLSLFLIMLIPAYAEITEFSIEKEFYTIGEGIVFIGATSEKNSMVNIVIENPNKKESYFVGATSDSNAEFKTVPKNVSNFFSVIGTYQFTAFTIQKDDGINISLEFDGSKVMEEIIPLLKLNPITDQSVEVGKTILFYASITDESFIDTYDGRDPQYSLENAPADAIIDSNTGKFIWTPSKSYESFEDVNYNFDIIVNADNQ